MKTWKKPKLIVLLKGETSEAVLGYCKTAHVPGAPNFMGLNCLINLGPPIQYCKGDVIS